MSSLSHTLSGNVPWHRQFPNTDLSRNLQAEMKGWEFQPVNGTFVRSFGSPSNETVVIIGLGTRGFYYITAHNGFVASRDPSGFYRTPKEAAEAAIAMLRERGIVDWPAPAQPVPSADPHSGTEQPHQQ